MNKKTIIIIVSIVCSLLLIGGGITGVVLLTGDKEPTSTKLDTMTVTLTENVASWETCENAEKYEISINGALSYLENSVTSYTLKKGETFKIRAVGDGTNYLTSDWSNQVTYDTEETYTIIWKNGDTIIHVDSNVLEGTLPEYDGPTPTKPSTNGISYKFKGWTPEVSIVTKDETYYALFEETLNTYTVTWKNGDTILEIDEFVEYGETPEYNGSTPTKEANETYTYTFIGWDKEISKVTSDVTYTAKFKEEKVLYKVSFYDEDGTTLLDEVYVGYGETASYSKTTPKKESVNGTNYIFDKWVLSLTQNDKADLTNVKGNLNVYAFYKQDNRTTTIYIVINNTEFGSVSQNVVSNVLLGTEILTKDNKLLIGDLEIIATPTNNTPEYSYSFDRWNANAFVTENTTINVYFTRSLNTYTVTWKNGDEILEVDKNVAYGSIPIYNGETPTKNNNDNKSYVFSGWSPVVNNVTKDIIYQAEFSVNENNVVVTFYDYDGVTILYVDLVQKGSNVSLPEFTPSRAPEVAFTYKFEKWVTEINGNIDANFENVQTNVSVYAKYTRELRKYLISFVDFDGTIIDESELAYGEEIKAPSSIDRNGFRFIGWSESFSTVNKEMTIYAVYEPVINVVFLNNYGQKLYSKNYTKEEFSFIKSIEAPEIKGYKFTYWQNESSGQKFDSFDWNNTTFGETYEFYPVYKKLYLVTYLDFEDNVLEVDYLSENEKIDINNLPNIPSREGYEAKWDKEYLSSLTIISDISVYPLYEVKIHKVEYYNVDGSLFENGVVEVEYGSFAKMPNVNMYYFDGTNLLSNPTWYIKNTNRPYVEIENNTIFDVKSDLSLSLKYEIEVLEPYVLVKLKGNIAEISITIPNNTLLYSIAFSFTCSNKIVGINSIVPHKNSCLTDNKCNNPLCTAPKDKNDWYDFNNKTNSFDFIWNCGNGHSSDFRETTLIIDFSVPNTDIILTESDIVTSLDSHVIWGNKNDSIENSVKSSLIILVY